MLNILWGCTFCVCAALSIVLYRLGGTDYFDTKVRDIGAPLTLLLAFLPWLHPHYVIILVLWVTHAAACTPGYGGEGEPVKDQSHLYRWFGRLSFLAAGILMGLAALPLAWLGVPVGCIIGRSLIVGGLVSLLHDGRYWLYENLFYEWFNDVAEMEEMLRWLIVVVTFWLVLP